MYIFGCNGEFFSEYEKDVHRHSNDTINAKIFILDRSNDYFWWYLHYMGIVKFHNAFDVHKL
jgi:hypothetical protein